MDVGDLIEIAADAIGAIMSDSSNIKNVLIGLGFISILIGIISLIVIYLV